MRFLGVVQRILLVAGIMTVVVWVKGSDGTGPSVPFWAAVLGAGVVGAVLLWRWLHRDTRPPFTEGLRLAALSGLARSSS